MQGMLALAGQAAGAMFGAGGGDTQYRHDFFFQQLQTVVIGIAGAAYHTVTQVAVQQQRGQAAHQDQIGCRDPRFFGHVHYTPLTPAV
ncbi:hypothetical protein [Deinococcus radiophilus]|uniref:hypothetical protein n=1 Tax=Deinococcus radiophilus TaxID=32062 RepID=UPI0036119BC1